LQEPPNAAPNRVVSTKEASFFLKPFLKSFSTSCPHPLPIAWAKIPPPPHSPQPSSTSPTHSKKSVTQHATGTFPADSPLFLTCSPNQPANNQNH
jgi:hypothetical protein